MGKICLLLAAAINGAVTVSLLLHCAVGERVVSFAYHQVFILYMSEADQWTIH